MKQYFLHDGIAQQGPFHIEELKAKQLSKSTPIWHEGLDAWTTVGALEELNSLAVATPPPFATKETAIPLPPPIREIPKQKGAIGKKLLILAGIIVLALIGFFVFNQIQHQQYQNSQEMAENSEEAAKSIIRNNISSYITVQRNEYRYSEFGGIHDLELTVNNNTDYLIDKVTVRVVYIKANGDVWDSRDVDFSLLSPNSKSTIKVADTERGTSVQYEITSIKSSALDLN